MQIRLQNLTESDLSEIYYLEEVAWAEDVRASKEKLSDRLRTFGEGFFGAFADDRLVGMASCQIINYYVQEQPVTWTTLTADGWISKTHRRNGDCLHFVSICVHPGSRHLGIATRLNEARLGLAEQLGLEWALTDTRVPGLGRYLKNLSSETPESYINQVVSGAVSEPVVEMYLKLGFQVLGLVADCMVSDVESANYGLAMIKKINP